MIPEEFIQELKLNSDIESVVSSYVNLKRRGRTAQGLCPFHSEKTPSFHVYPESQSFYCFGCGAGGDVVTFIRKMENLDYVEALRFLAQRAGMVMPEEVRDDGSARRKGRILELNRTAARFYHSQLFTEEGKRALSYLTERGLTPKTIRHFGLGYSPSSWDSGIRQFIKEGFTVRELQDASLGLTGRNGGLYDCFRGRVMFPIIDLRGNVIGFGGRIIGEGGPKYLNSADTQVFKKSRNLFALNFAKASKREGIILAEGYMDVIALHQAGFDNAVATLGTALTPDQARLLLQYTDEVTLSYDSDEAGQKATKRAIDIFSQIGMKVRVLRIPDAKDPDEYIKKFGAQRFSLLLTGASNSTEFEIAKLKAKYDLATDDGKLGFLKEFSGFAAGISNAVERDIYLSRISQELSVSKQALEETVNASVKAKVRAQQKKEQRSLKPYVLESSASSEGINELERRKNMKYVVAEEKLIEGLLKNPDFYTPLREMVAPEDFVTEQNRRIFEVLCERIKENLSTDMIALSGMLDEKSLGVLSRLLAQARGYKYTMSEMGDYVKRLKEKQGQKTGEEIGRMDEREFAQYLKTIASNKK